MCSFLKFPTKLLQFQAGTYIFATNLNFKRSQNIIWLLDLSWNGCRSYTCLPTYLKGFLQSKWKNLSWTPGIQEYQVLDLYTYAIFTNSGPQSGIWFKSLSAVPTCETPKHLTETPRFYWMFSIWLRCSFTYILHLHLGNKIVLQWILYSKCLQHTQNLNWDQSIEVNL